MTLPSWMTVLAFVGEHAQVERWKYTSAGFAPCFQGWPVLSFLGVTDGGIWLCTWCYVPRIDSKLLAAWAVHQSLGLPRCGTLRTYLVAQIEGMD